MFKEVKPPKDSGLPDFKKKQIEMLWRTRADSFSRHQLRIIIRDEKAKLALEVDGG